MMHPHDFVRLSSAWWKMMLDSNSVVAYRMFGMSGLSKVPASEMARMVAEKPPAFAEASLAASRAAMAGARPDQVALAWMEPVSRKASSNNRRLSRKTRK